MKHQKIFLCTLLATLLSVQIIGYSWLIFHVENIDLKVSILDVCYSLYLFFLGISCVRQVERHSELVWHLTTLTTLPAVLMLFATIIPNHQTSEASLLWLWRTVWLLYISLAVTTMNTPLGPPLHYPLSAIYPEEIVHNITSTDNENVVGVVGESLVSRFRTMLNNFRLLTLEYPLFLVRRQGSFAGQPR
jgi:hypothetical protein